MCIRRMAGVWGKVKLAVMKFPIALQAQSSTQAQSKNLKIYAKIGLSERGKPRTPKFGACRERRKLIEDISIS